MGQYQAILTMLPLVLWFSSVFIWNYISVGSSCSGLPTISVRPVGQRHQAEQIQCVLNTSGARTWCYALSSKRKDRCKLALTPPSTGLGHAKDAETQTQVALWHRCCGPGPGRPMPQMWGTVLRAMYLSSQSWPQTRRNQNQEERTR